MSFSPLRRLLRPLGVLLNLFVLGSALLGCGSDEGPDPAQAPKTNVQARSTPATADSVTLDEPEAAPDVVLETMAGDRISLSDSPDKVLLVNFWATWCPPCRKEIPDLVELQQDLGPEGLTIVGVATDEEGRSVVQPFADEHEINYPIVIDSTRTLQSELGPVYGLPTTLLINPDGQVVKRVVGIFPTEPYRPVLKEMLATAKGAS